jgi:PKD repeat protein
MFQQNGFQNTGFQTLKSEAPSDFKSLIKIIGSTKANIVNYVVKLHIPYESEKMRTDFGDIKFSDIAGNDLDYELENYIDGNWALFRVKIPLLIQNISNYIFMYAGNPTTTTGSNPLAVYSSYDGCLSLENFVVVAGNPSIIDNTLVLNSNDSVRKEYNVTLGYRAEYRYKQPSSYRNRIYINHNNGPDSGAMPVDYGYFNPIYFGGWSGANLTPNQWYTVEQCLDDDGMFYWNNYSDDRLTSIYSNRIQSGLNTSQSHGKIIFNPTEGGSAFDIDWVKISPYIYPEPSVESISEWQSNTEAPFAIFDYILDYSGNVILSNQTINADSYLWDFGDDTTSTEENPSHTYTKNGYYDISLTTTNSLGTSTITKTILVVVSTIYEWANNSLNDWTPIHPENISIIDSTIFNRKVIQCISQTNAGKGLIYHSDDNKVGTWILEYALTDGAPLIKLSISSDHQEHQAWDSTNEIYAFYYCPGQYHSLGEHGGANLTSGNVGHSYDYNKKHTLEITRLEGGLTTLWVDDVPIESFTITDEQLPNGMNIVAGTTFIAGTIEINRIIYTPIYVPSSEAQNINYIGIESEELFGIPSLSGRNYIDAIGIVSDELINVFDVKNINYINLEDIISEEAFGNPDIRSINHLYPLSIESGENFGLLTLKGINHIKFNSIISSEHIGYPKFKRVLKMLGVESDEAFGNLNVTFNVVMRGITSSEVFGTFHLSWTQFLDFLGITTAEAFGEIILAPYHEYIGLKIKFTSPRMATTMKSPYIIFKFVGGDEQ